MSHSSKCFDYIQAAKRLYPTFSIDEDTETVDVTGDGLGAYVQARVWVPADSLDTSTSPYDLIQRLNH